VDNICFQPQKLAKIDADLTQADRALVIDEIYDVAVQTIVELDSLEKRACHDPRLRGSKKGVKVSFVLPY